MEIDWTHVTAPRRNEQAWLTSRYGRCSMTKSTPRISRVLRMLSRCLFGAAWPTSRDATSLEQSVINRHSLCQSLYQSTSLNSPDHMPIQNTQPTQPVTWPIQNAFIHAFSHLTDTKHPAFSTSLLTDTKHPDFSTSHLTDTKHPDFSTSLLTDTKHPDFSTSLLTDTKHPDFSTSH